ncbi:hypothetical protein AX774_g3104 [Zancudomyces culisetae]|uniref:Retrotransposon gag domain-containing protein n=1 Tax=Zancudomyces culisetae TaxID=1213189 RepID=A0A1R1PQY4_ZANCU|nr:hypothetical protein AX774_g3104 [Zancudomyces culisetae]|eukprot:OMH83396.1 hypothetical protein AX774_g3104 [Zancudomyces culisetae]
MKKFAGKSSEIKNGLVRKLCTISWHASEAITDFMIRFRNYTKTIPEDTLTEELVKECLATCLATREESLVLSLSEEIDKLTWEEFGTIVIEKIKMREAWDKE